MGLRFLAALVALASIAPAYADHLYVPDYACGGYLDPATNTERDVCAVALRAGHNRIDVLMPFVQHGTWAVRVATPDRPIAFMRCTSVEEITQGSWTCEGSLSQDGEAGGSSGLLWADGYIEANLPVDAVLTLSAGRGEGIVTVRGRWISG